MLITIGIVPAEMVVVASVFNMLVKIDQIRCIVRRAKKHLQVGLNWNLVVMVIDRTAWTEEDDLVLEQITRSGLPTIMVVNKIDLLEDKSRLLPWLEALAQKGDFTAILPVSALRRHNVEALEAE